MAHQCQLEAYLVRLQNLEAAGLRMRALAKDEESASTPGKVWQQAMGESEFVARKTAVDEWNSQNRFVKKGIAITPMKVSHLCSLTVHF